MGSDTEVAPPNLPLSRTLSRILLGFGLLLAVAVVALPLWASFDYRSATGELHQELAAVEIESADIVDVAVDQCWNGSSPASVRVLIPTAGHTLTQVVDDYIAALEPLGYDDQGGVVGRVASRERSDDLDGDVIDVTIDDAGGWATVAAQPWDTDMVFCLPF